jgi:uncharacterized protein
VRTPDGPRPFRRDTHDGPIPEAVFALLAFTLSRCPLLEVVFVERLGKTLHTALDVAQYRTDYGRVRAVVAAAGQADG